MTDSQIRKRYLFHTLFHKFTEELFFAFGALLIYAKTGSILGTLLFAVIGHVGTLLIKSAGFASAITLFRKWGLVSSMTFGLLLKVIALGGIFYLSPESAYFYPILFSLHILENAGNTLYVFGASAIMLEVIGAAKAPGHSSAQIKALHIFSGLLAALTGVWLNSQGSFLSSFLIGGAVLLGSTIPLRGLPTPQLPQLSFRQNLRSISLPLFLANMNPNHQMKVIGLPLIILSLSASLDTSIMITAGVAIAGIMASYIAGWVRDHHGSWMVWLALVAGILGWGAYGFVNTAQGFLLASIVVGLATEVIGVGREARMAIDLKGNLLGGTMAFEFARTLGTFIGSSILLIAYVATGSLPQALLAIGGLFLIPKAIYAVGSPR